MNTGSSLTTSANNAGLLADQKVRTRDQYYTFDKAIRHTMSRISSADGHCQQRKVNEKWGKSRERVSLSMILPFAQHKIQISTFPTHSLFSQLSLPVRANAKSIGENRSLARLPPLLICFSLLTVTISR